MVIPVVLPVNKRKNQLAKKYLVKACKKAQGLCHFERTNIIKKKKGVGSVGSGKPS